MILHFQHHKEGRNFSTRPVTGNYTDCHVYLNIIKFKYSRYGEGDPRNNYHFLLEYKGNKAELAEKVNIMCNNSILYYHESSNELWLSKSCFPEILTELPSKQHMPCVYSSNPARLVEILVA